MNKCQLYVNKTTKNYANTTAAVLSESGLLMDGEYSLEDIIKAVATNVAEKGDTIGPRKELYIRRAVFALKKKGYLSSSDGGLLFKKTEKFNNLCEEIRHFLHLHTFGSQLEEFRVMGNLFGQRIGSYKRPTMKQFFASAEKEIEDLLASKKVLEQENRQYREELEELKTILNTQSLPRTDDMGSSGDVEMEPLENDENVPPVQTNRNDDSRNVPGPSTPLRPRNDYPTPPQSSERQLRKPHTAPELGRTYTNRKELRGPPKKVDFLKIQALKLEEDLLKAREENRTLKEEVVHYRSRVEQQKNAARRALNEIYKDILD